ncbi:gibberellin-regulated protein 1-like [Cornus florida]|uniref:gibberellin-regulated protein 1-like n=1 Tax=Cornus florida TaxID=4283 RepID=UPI00289E5209|nr:gibberellin-regulated protein 1-like [Cornus florida]
MAISKALIASLLVSLLVFHLVEADQAVIFFRYIYMNRSDCGSACAGRCRLSSRPNLCKRACGTCCERCNCVPPGTSGNEDVCPCYANMTTHGGKHKCP